MLQNGINQNHGNEVVVALVVKLKLNRSISKAILIMGDELHFVTST